MLCMVMAEKTYHGVTRMQKVIGIVHAERSRVGHYGEHIRL